MKALALGADAVLVGWALVMGLAANGQPGRYRMINTLTAELQRIMRVTGCRQVSKIDSGVLVRRDCHCCTGSRNLYESGFLAMYSEREG